MQIAVGGCLAQKDRELVRRRAGHVDVVFGTHNLARAPELLRRAAAEGPVVEILDAPDPEADRRPAAAALGRPRAALRRLGHHPDRAATTPAPSASCPRCAGAEVEPARRRPRRRGARPGRRGGGRGHPARPERQLLRPGPDPPAAALRRPAAGGGRGRGDPPGPLHQPAPQGPPARDHRGHGRGRRRSATSCTCRCSPGSDRVLAAMRRGLHRRALPGPAGRRPGRPIADLAVTTDVIVGFPGETDDDFERTLEVVAEAAYDSAYTFIFSPRPGTRAAAMDDRFVAPEVVAERFERLRAVVERSALGPPPGPDRPGGGGAGRGAEPARPVGDHRAAPARASWSTSPRAGPAPAAGVLRRGGGDRGRPPPPGRGAASTVTARPRHRTRIPVAAG